MLPYLLVPNLRYYESVLTFFIPFHTFSIPYVFHSQTILKLNPCYFHIYILFFLWDAGPYAKHSEDSQRVISNVKVTGRLWDDHLGQLGYQSKFDTVQDAKFTQNSNYGSNSGPLFVKKHKKMLIREKVLKQKTARQPGHSRPSVYPQRPLFLIKEY